MSVTQVLKDENITSLSTSSLKTMEHSELSFRNFMQNLAPTHVMLRFQRKGILQL